MPDNDTLIKLTTALNRIEEIERLRKADREEFEKLHEENRTEIETIKARLSSYDILAAKWGGMCMLALGIGTIVFEFPEKFKAILGFKP